MTKIKKEEMNKDVDTVIKMLHVKNEEEISKIKQIVLHKIDEMIIKFETSFQQFIDYQKQKAVQENKETQTLFKSSLFTP